MEVKVLGTESPVCKIGHNCPGFLIKDGDYRIMLDCGSGTHSLLEYPDDLQNLSVIISHLHRDHYNDVFNLQYASFVFHNQGRLEKPIEIYLPQTPIARSEDIRSESDSFARYYFINDKLKFNIGNIKVDFCQTNHPIETYAIRLQKGDKTLVYTSDTSYSSKDKLVEFAKDADLLICESSLLKKHGFPEINYHLTATQAAQIAKQANVKLLGLTHFWFEENIHEYIDEARDVFKNSIALKEGQIIGL